MSPAAVVPARILLVRLSAMGDILMAAPLASALRRRFPEARIDWLVQPEFADLLRHHPAVDQVLIWPRHQWMQLWRERQWQALWRLTRALRTTLIAGQYDWVLDLQGLLKSGMLARLTGAPRRIGLGSREGAQWLMHQVVPRGGDPDAISSEYQFLATDLGLEPRPFAPELFLSAAERHYCAEIVVRLGLQEGYVAACPFTTRPQKHWLAPRWTELAQRIHATWGWPLLLLGGPSDASAAATIAAPGAPIHNLVGKTRILEAAALIAGSRFTVGVDTGLGHMGIALDRPTVLLFGSTCPYRRTPKAAVRVLHHAFPCSPCKRRPRCHGRFDCMAAIHIDEVLNAAQAVLEEGSCA